MDFSAQTILCVGDVMLDRFIDCEMERISPEAPVPVLRLLRKREMLGGVGNVASNVASLGGRAILVGLLGRDEEAASLRRAADAPGIVPAFVDTPHRPTICKTRFVAARQQVLRADEESLHPLHPEEEASVLAAALAHLGAAGAVILSDYGKGLLAPRLIAALMARARAAGVPVFVDPKSLDFSIYRGAACVTPNARELAAAVGGPVAEDADAVAAARRALAASGAAAVLVTRSERGMALVQEGSGEAHLAPSRAREVFDVSGAGDTVIAALALAHAAGRTLEQAMHVANAAAGVVVGKPGTATASVAEVLHELDAQDQERRGAESTGLLPRGQARALVERWRAAGLRVGFANGCFDLLHPGHVALLAAARAACDRLVVALNDDASVARLKGPARPVNALAHRAQVMAAIRYVDCVTGFAGDTPLELIRLLRPDVLVKGADYTEDAVVGGDLVRAAGGRVLLAKLEAGHSTTATIARMQGVDRGGDPGGRTGGEGGA